MMARVGGAGEAGATATAPRTPRRCLVAIMPENLTSVQKRTEA